MSSSSSAPTWTPASEHPGPDELEGVAVAFWTTLRDTAALFRKSDRTIQRYMDRGIPHHGSGHELRFPWPHVFVWIAEFQPTRSEGQGLPRHLPFNVALARHDAAVAEWEWERQRAGEWI